jgi:hypothetical protein
VEKVFGVAIRVMPLAVCIYMCVCLCMWDIACVGKAREREIASSLKLEGLGEKAFDYIGLQ